MAGKTTIATLVLAVVAAAALMEGAAAATTYVVGDTTGWIIPTGGAAFYSTWAANHTFAVGDNLIFNFVTGAHDVATVNKTSYDSCSSASPISLQTTGPANVTLTTSGEHYFICTFGQHCASGQKLSVNVAAAGSPTPSPSPSIGLPPDLSPVSVADNDFVFPPVAPLPPSPQSTSQGTIAGVAAGVALVLAALVIALCYWRRRKLPDHFFNVPAEADLEVHLEQLKRFSLRELEIATNYFNNKNIIGRGGSSKVYKGRLADGSLVAVKRLKAGSTHGRELQFQTEVELISMADHRNLLRLRGYCMTPTERALVYPYMANGSVASCLRERPESQAPLDWPTRKQIALGAARGLAYLHSHCDPKIIHRDVKVANILLDEEFEAVVGDFGLAKLMDYKDTHVTTAIRGTIGHIAPEYLSTGKSSEKTDVFGYGIMLLELITGRSAFDIARLGNDHDVMLLDRVKGLLNEKKLEMLVDTDMQGNYVHEEVEELIQVALLCTQESPNGRPKMLEVVRMLEGDGLAERWEAWQKEVFRLEFSNTQHTIAAWIVADSTSNLRPVELSGPR